MNNTTIKKYGVIAVVVILVTVLLFSCSGSKKDVAMDFATAMLKDFDAKEMVSLMSDDCKEEYMSQMGAETEKILISKLKENFKSIEENYEDEYGDNWKVKIEHVDTYELDNDIYAVALSVKFKGSGGFLGLSDKEDTEEMTVALVKESGKWKVCDFELD